MIRKATHRLITKSYNNYEVCKCGEHWFAIKEGFHIEHENIVCLTPLEATEETKEPETFDWKRAAKLWADGVEIEVAAPNSNNLWRPIKRDSCAVYFLEEHFYRIKPVPVVKEMYANFFNGSKSICFYNSRESLDDSIAYRNAVIHITTHDNVPVKCEILKP